ncbi:MAG: hypothetical protein JRI96_03090 [Deltaproteobacteria bacterium]|nr:hypothetical protein [Deltaproteobacteria bacterium]MBW2300035.1 hypothetical protein [Deltaproteobacteria bacterium]
MSTVKATRRGSKEALADSGLKRLDSMLAHGVTTLEGKSGYGLDLETEIKQLGVMEELDSVHPVDIVRTFLGAHAVPEEYKGNEDGFIDFLVGEVKPEVAERGLAEFCDVFCEKGVFSITQSRRILEHARKMGFKLKIHADEMASLGGAELAAELGCISADHLLHVSDKGMMDMSEKGLIATLLPATAFSLKEPYARGRAMVDVAAWLLCAGP